MSIHFDSRYVESFRPQPPQQLASLCRCLSWPRNWHGHLDTNQQWLFQPEFEAYKSKCGWFAGRDGQRYEQTYQEDTAAYIDRLRWSSTDSLLRQSHGSAASLLQGKFPSCRRSSSICSKGRTTDCLSSIFAWAYLWWRSNFRAWRSWQTS